MPQLESAIEKAADAFAREIIAAVKAASLQELLALEGGAVAAATQKRGRPAKVEAPARRRGRPPKAKPGRKPGRPAKAKPGRKPGRPPKAVARVIAKKPGRKPAKKVAKKAAKKAAMTSANKKRSAHYPKCSVPGCGKNRYSKGNGMCGEHFLAAQAR